MKAMLRKFVMLIVAVTIAFAVSPLFAKKSKGGTPPGQAKQQITAAGAPARTPPGWSRGKKTGWQGGDYPPGWSRWNKNKQQQWTNDRDRANGDIREISNRYAIPNEKQDEIVNAFNQAIAGGLVVNDAANRLATALQDESSRRGIMINTTQSVLDLLK